jgi:hypothetical protein
LTVAFWPFAAVHWCVGFQLIIAIVAGLLAIVTMSVLSTAPGPV